jgi:hypothetical protein
VRVKNPSHRRRKRIVKDCACSLTLYEPSVRHNSRPYSAHFAGVESQIVEHAAGSNRFEPMSFWLPPIGLEPSIVGYCPSRKSSPDQAGKIAKAVLNKAQQRKFRKSELTGFPSLSLGRTSNGFHTQRVLHWRSGFLTIARKSRHNGFCQCRTGSTARVSSLSFGRADTTFCCKNIDESSTILSFWF